VSSITEDEQLCKSLYSHRKRHYCSHSCKNKNELILDKNEEATLSETTARSSLMPSWTQVMTSRLRRLVMSSGHIALRLYS